MNATWNAGVERVLGYDEAVEVVRALERLGYQCLEAGDGAEASRMLQAHGEPVDAVVTGLVMPHMNGRELSEHLAALKPGLPVLFMSGYTNDEMIRRDLLAPEASFIQKPSDVEELAAKLRALFVSR